MPKNRSYDYHWIFNNDSEADAANTENRYEAMKAAVMDVVGGHFRPEFINRIDEVVVFHPLAKDQIHGIAEIQLLGLRKRLAEKELGLNISGEVMDRLAEVGFDPVLRSSSFKEGLSSQYLENPMAQDVLAGKFNPGDEIVVELIDGTIQLRGQTRQ